MAKLIDQKVVKEIISNFDIHELMDSNVYVMGSAGNQWWHLEKAAQTLISQEDEVLQRYGLWASAVRGAITSGISDMEDMKFAEAKGWFAFAANGLAAFGEVLAKSDESECWKIKPEDFGLPKGSFD